MQKNEMILTQNRDAQISESLDMFTCLATESGRRNFTLNMRKAIFLIFQSEIPTKSTSSSLIRR